MIDDKELIRRALLGNPEAQKKCTEKGVVLICPCCKSDAELITETANFTGEPERDFHTVRCKSCFLKTGLYKTQRDALHKWNTRPAPPVGMCKDCVWSREPTEEDYKELDRDLLSYKDSLVCDFWEREVWCKDLCGYFEPREE